MIIYHQKNVAAFKGNHVHYNLMVIPVRFSITSAAAANTLIEQSRSISRFVFTRLFSRVN